MSLSFSLPCCFHRCSDHISFSQANQQGSLSGKPWHRMTLSSDQGQSPNLASHRRKSSDTLPFYCPAKWSHSMKDKGVPGQGNLITNACDREHFLLPGGEDPLMLSACAVSISLPGGTTLGPYSSGGTNSTTWIPVTQLTRTKPDFPWNHGK